MESNYYGADKEEFFRRRAEEKKAMFDEIRRRIVEANSQPLTREEFLRKSAEIAARNRARKEQLDQDNNAS